MSLTFIYLLVCWLSEGIGLDYALLWSLMAFDLLFGLLRLFKYLGRRRK